MRKETGIEPLSLRLYRLLARPMTALLTVIELEPNVISLYSILCSIAAGVWLVWAHPVMASLLLIANMVSDRCDGEVARATNQCTRYGVYLSALNGNITYLALLLCTATGVYLSTGDMLYLWAGISAIVFKYLCRLNDRQRYSLIKNSVASSVDFFTEVKRGLLRRIFWEVAAYIIHSYGMIISLLVLSIFGLQRYFVLFYGAVFPAQFVVQMIIHRMDLKE